MLARHQCRDTGYHQKIFPGTPKISGNPMPVSENNSQEPNININPKVRETQHTGSMGEKGHRENLVHGKNGSLVKMGLREKWVAGENGFPRKMGHRGKSVDGKNGSLLKMGLRGKIMESQN